LTGTTAMPSIYFFPSPAGPIRREMLQRRTFQRRTFQLKLWER
jgi:hypothetical protein